MEDKFLNIVNKWEKPPNKEPVIEPEDLRDAKEADLPKTPDLTAVYEQKLAATGNYRYDLDAMDDLTISPSMRKNIMAVYLDRRELKAIHFRSANKIDSMERHMRTEFMEVVEDVKSEIVGYYRDLGVQLADLPKVEVLGVGTSRIGGVFSNVDVCAVAIPRIENVVHKELQVLSRIIHELTHSAGVVRDSIQVSDGNEQPTPGYGGFKIQDQTVRMGAGGVDLNSESYYKGDVSILEEAAPSYLQAKLFRKIARKHYSLEEIDTYEKRILDSLNNSTVPFNKLHEYKEFCIATATMIDDDSKRQVFPSEYFECYAVLDYLQDKIDGFDKLLARSRVLEDDLPLVKSLEEVFPREVGVKSFYEDIYNTPYRSAHSFMQRAVPDLYKRLMND
ncbi:MAG: hypothetical protein ACI83D_000458 [Planctomycetota bacterium]|jgi:hypothetical protein